MAALAFLPPPGEEEDGAQLVWYASIGSMMNRVGLRVRGVHPLESCPCIIPGRRRVFSEPGGMATLTEPEDGAECHSVAHLMPLRELRVLEAREPDSVELPVILLRLPGSKSGPRVREGAIAAVSVGQFTGETMPHERYIDIMVRGAAEVCMPIFCFI